jgi:tRNA(adenine34) deaminase
MGGDFNELVEQQVSILRSGELRQLEAAAAERRRAWVAVHGLGPCVDRATPRGAYELFFRDYLGLSLDDVPVLFETATEIAWRSVNPCPTLEACLRLGLDTRRVCRAVYEKSTQAFFSALDPELRFHRSYDMIRPHAQYCEERIVRVDFEALMQIAIEEAKLSRAEGNKGYGAVIVFDGEVIARAHDTAATARDPSLHAELNAIRSVCAQLGTTDQTGAVMVSSCEPCPMCSSLAVWANVTTIVYGASIEETAALGKARIQIPAKEVVARSPTLVEVIGGVLREECLALYA